MEKKQKTSLTWQLILTMVVIVEGTVAMCWFFNTTFLEKYYIFHKEKELKSSFDQVRLICEKQGDSSDDAYVQFERICANGNINMLIADQDRNLIWSSYSSAQRFQMQMEDWLYGSDRSRVQVLSSGKDYTLLRQTDERLQSEYLVLLGTLKNGNNLYMRAAVESIRESASITNQFFVMVSMGAIILSVILIIVLSKGISHPIHALSDIARRMTQLDFDAKYIPVRHVSREIDELGNSMNELSETLEETISELKTANVSLQQDIEKKEQIDEMRKEFLSNVSHELKTPIALIQGYAEGLKECINDDPESREFYCEVIMDESSKMNQMVKKLLTLNQLEFGNDVVTMERFDLVSLVKGVIQSASILAQQKEAKLLFNEEEPVYVWADEFKVEEVVTNYISNALNHLEGDKVIDVKLIHEPGNVIRTTVFNTGKPIPEEDLDKIWIKFYKVDKARTREYGGSGIGLSIVKAIMDSFHQKCGVKNYDNGVEFWFELDGGEKCGNSGKDDQRLLPGAEQS